ncbi:MAG: hypothetical protein MJZ73_06490 [Bacteroidaceae bacterium]|nr:hypothetical protein [Bacteroidaceae bacterium]
MDLFNDDYIYLSSEELNDAKGGMRGYEKCGCVCIELNGNTAITDGIWAGVSADNN